jgi:hypothetical protein
MKTWIQIETWMYSLQLQLQQITITWSSFFDNAYLAMEFTWVFLWDQLGQLELARLITPATWHELELPFQLLPCFSLFLNWTLSVLCSLRSGLKCPRVDCKKSPIVPAEVWPLTRYRGNANPQRASWPRQRKVTVETCLCLVTSKHVTLLPP